MSTIRCLGIETSCDETSVAVVSSDKKILYHEIFSQNHDEYGGVVPELASRAHIQKLHPMIKKLLTNVQLESIDIVASAVGPGLMGGLIVGTMFARSLAMGLGKPFVPVNHLEAHALTVRLTKNVEFPYLLYLISGGHCQLVEVLELGKYRMLAQTIDDSVGETFDKVARVLGLPYPGGPHIEKLAKLGDPDAYQFKIPNIKTNDIKSKREDVKDNIEKNKNTNRDVSFSGIKTAVKNIASVIKAEQEKFDLCASFQKACSRFLTISLERSIPILSYKHKRFVIAGGVAANKTIREAFEKVCNQYDMEFFVAPMELCTDNAAMIAWCGLELFSSKVQTEISSNSEIFSEGITGDIVGNISEDIRDISRGIRDISNIPNPNLKFA